MPHISFHTYMILLKKEMENIMMKQYEMFELKFQADPPVNSNVEIDLQAEFTQQGRSLTVKGFYAGNNEYKPCLTQGL